MTATLKAGNPSSAEAVVERGIPLRDTKAVFRSGSDRALFLGPFVRLSSQGGFSGRDG